MATVKPSTSCHCMQSWEETPSQVQGRSLPAWHRASNTRPTTCCDFPDPTCAFKKKKNHRHFKITSLSLFWRSASSLSAYFKIYLLNTLYHWNGTQSFKRVFRWEDRCLREGSMENQLRNLLKWHKTGGKKNLPLLLKSRRQIWTLFHYFPRAWKKVTSS